MGRGDEMVFLHAVMAESQKAAGVEHAEAQEEQQYSCPGRVSLLGFHHLELWTAEARLASRSLSQALGLPLVARSDQSTGNYHYASVVLQSGAIRMVITAPLSQRAHKLGSRPPCPWFLPGHAHEIISTHGLFVRAVGVLVDDAAAAYSASTATVGVGVLEPQTIRDPAGGGELVLSEVQLLGDCVLRFVSGNFQGPFLPGYLPVEGASSGLAGPALGLEQLSCVCCAATDPQQAANYICKAAGLQEVSAEASGKPAPPILLTSSNGRVRLAVTGPCTVANSPDRGSEVQAFLDQNEGPGVQCLMITAKDIVATVAALRARAGGIQTVYRSPPSQPSSLPPDSCQLLSEEQQQQVQKLGLVVDKDAQGVLLRAVTEPLGDRCTLRLEIQQMLLRIS